MEWDDASWKLCILLVYLDPPCLLNGGGWEQEELPRVSGRTVSARLENSSNGGFDSWDFAWEDCPWFVASYMNCRSS